VDPLTSSYPWYTPYQFVGNKPIKFSDLDGLEEKKEGTASTITNKSPLLGGLPAAAIPGRLTVVYRASAASSKSPLTALVTDNIAVWTTNVLYARYLIKEYNSVQDNLDQLRNNIINQELSVLEKALEIEKYEVFNVLVEDDLKAAYPDNPFHDHHIIPQQLRKGKTGRDDCIGECYGTGTTSSEYDKPWNLVKLPGGKGGIHGPHPQWNEYVRNQWEEYKENNELDDLCRDCGELEKHLKKFADKMRKDLLKRIKENPGKRINEIYKKINELPG
jgi:hypothetical protein